MSYHVIFFARLIVNPGSCSEKSHKNHKTKLKMIFQFTAKWLSWSVLLLPLGLSCGDQIDIKMEEAMKKMNIRGASLVFFDKVSNMFVCERSCVCIGYIQSVIHLFCCCDHDTEPFDRASISFLR